MAAYGFRHANPPKRRRAPFLTISTCFGPVIRQIRAHIMQQKIGVRPDQLKALFRLILQSVGNEFRCVTSNASGGIEQFLTIQHFRIRKIPSCRNSQIAAVEGHEIKRLVIDFKAIAGFIRTMRCCKAFRLVFSAFTCR